MTKEEIGEILKKLRIKCGMTQKEVAEKIGRNQPIIGHWETGYSQPDANTLFTLCDIYGTTVDEAFGFIRKNINVSSVEYEHIKKYRLIADQDPDGKVLVDSTIDYLCSKIKQMHDSFTELTAQAEQIIELKKAIIPKRFISYYQRLASAGSGEYLFDSIPTDTIEVPENNISKQADFVIGVNGHSMEPTYNNGDRVYVQISKTIPIGSIGIFTRGNDCFIKELGHDRLISHNSNKKIYPDIPASNDIRCVGLVLGKVTNI